MVQIPEVIRYATNKLIAQIQAIGAGIGAVAGLVLGIAFRRKPRAAGMSAAAPSVVVQLISRR